MTVLSYLMVHELYSGTYRPTVLIIWMENLVGGLYLRWIHDGNACVVQRCLLDSGPYIHGKSIGRQYLFQINT